MFGNSRFGLTTEDAEDTEFHARFSFRVFRVFRGHLQTASAVVVGRFAGPIARGRLFGRNLISTSPQPMTAVSNMYRENFMKTCSLLMILCCFAASSASAQIIPEYDLGGASKPKPDLSFKKENQYKRVHQSSLRFILRGELDKTEAFLTEYLANHPSDEETLYMLGILQGQRGNLEQAEAFLRRAIAEGLPEERLLAGPHAIMKPLAGTELLEHLNEKYENRIVHGPLVGNVTDTSASFWVRTPSECEVEVIAENADGSYSVKSPRVSSQASEDFTVVANVEGLRPGMEYQYRLRINRLPTATDAELSFRTMPLSGESSKFTIAFGGGAGFVPENERMWNTIGKFDPQAILLLGDNVYIDDPESVIMQQYTYQRRQSRPEWRKLTARSPVFTIWDDHDFSTNDSWGGPDIDVPFWKKDWVFPIFRQNWANPGYGGGDDQPGCWYSFQIARCRFHHAGLSLLSHQSQTIAAFNARPGPEKVVEKTTG